MVENISKKVDDNGVTYSLVTHVESHEVVGNLEEIKADHPILINAIQGFRAMHKLKWGADHRHKMDSKFEFLQDFEERTQAKIKKERIPIKIISRFTYLFLLAVFLSGCKGLILDNEENRYRWKQKTYRIHECILHRQT